MFVNYRFVKTLTGKTLSLDVELNNPLSSLKDIIKDKEGLPPHMQKLIYKGKQLTEMTKTFNDYNIYKESTIHLIVRLGGG